MSGFNRVRQAFQQQRELLLRGGFGSEPVGTASVSAVKIAAAGF